MSKTSELWWVSVGGNSCEPARVVTETIELEQGVERHQTVYTIGCADFTLLTPRCGIELVQEIESDEIPSTPKQQRRLDRQWRAQLLSRPHGYKRFP